MITPFLINRELRIEEVKTVLRPWRWGAAEGGSVFLKCGFRPIHLFTSLRFSVHMLLRDLIYFVLESTPSPSFLTSPFLPQLNLDSPVLCLAPWFSFTEPEILKQNKKTRNSNKFRLLSLLLDFLFLIGIQGLFLNCYFLVGSVLFLISRFSLVLSNLTYLYIGLVLLLFKNTF